MKVPWLLTSLLSVLLIMSVYLKGHLEYHDAMSKGGPKVVPSWKIPVENNSILNPKARINTKSDLR